MAQFDKRQSTEMYHLKLGVVTREPEAVTFNPANDKHAAIDPIQLRWGCQAGKNVDVIACRSWTHRPFQEGVLTEFNPFTRECSVECRIQPLVLLVHHGGHGVHAEQVHLQGIVRLPAQYDLCPYPMNTRHVDGEVEYPNLRCFPSRFPPRLEPSFDVLPAV
jgi:hypothetical protein